MDGRRESRVQLGNLAGFPLTGGIERSLGRTLVSVTFEGAPRSSLQLPAAELTDADPAGLVARLENRIGRLEEHKADALARAEHARQEIVHAAEGAGQPFAHGAELAQARDRVGRIDEQLQQMAAPSQPAEQADAGAVRGPEANYGHASYDADREAEA